MPAATTCVVPRLRGKKLKGAKNRIRAADRVVDMVKERKGATANDGKVFREKPKPGAEVPVTSVVGVDQMSRAETVRRSSPRDDGSFRLVSELGAHARFSQTLAAPARRPRGPDFADGPARRRRTGAESI